MIQKPNLEATDAIMDLFMMMSITPDDGVRTLLWLAGISMGHLHLPLATENNDYLGTLATAWKIGIDSTLDD